MSTQESVAAAPDYIASYWLRFRGCGHLPDDPNSSAQFDSALNCLSTLTTYFCEVSGPWCAVTPQEVRELHCDFNAWCRYTQPIQGSHELVPITLHHLTALSTRRLLALSEFGGIQREEYPMLQHLHKVITRAARRTRRNALEESGLLVFKGSHKQGDKSWTGEIPTPASVTT